MTRLYRDRRFATYWAGQAVSEFGDRVSELALPLIAITSLGASSVEVGALTAAVWAPQLLSLVVGAWVDQLTSKRRVLILSDVLQALAVATLPIVWWFGSLTLGQLLVVALVAGIGRTLFQTAYAPFFASLVVPDQYVEANSLLSSTRSGSFVAGPALGGALIQAVGPPAAMVVDALSFVFSARMISRVRTVERTPAGHGERLLHRAAHGFRYLWRNAYLAPSLRCCTTLNFFSFMTTSLIVLYANRTLGLAAGTIGLTLGTGAAGGLVGAVMAPRVARWIGAGHTIAMGAVLFSAPYALLPLANGAEWIKAAILAVVEAIAGFGIMLFDINLTALQTAVVRDDLRSRVAGAFSTVNYGIRPVGALTGGLMAGVVGVGQTLAVAGIGGALSFLWLLRSPVISTRAVTDPSPAT